MTIKEKTMTTIINLTQHLATEDQIAAGVVDLNDEDREELVRLLTFTSPPSAVDIEKRAWAIVRLATKIDPRPTAAMVGGAPYLMAPLEMALFAAGFSLRYAFSERRSIERTEPDGSVRKEAVFVHAGWVEVETDVADLRLSMHDAEALAHGLRWHFSRDRADEAERAELAYALSYVPRAVLGPALKSFLRNDD